MYSLFYDSRLARLMSLEPRTLLVNLGRIVPALSTCHANSFDAVHLYKRVNHPLQRS